MLKLHPPLLMTTRQSQQLSSLLKASFKKQLDAQHEAHSSGNEHYTNLHLQSILENPLFGTKPRTRTPSIHKSQPSLLNAMQYNIYAFEKQVSQGTADLEIAKLFLQRQYKMCLTSELVMPKDLMQSSGTASIVLQWLWSSGIEEKGTFLNDFHFVHFLIPFLVAEGHHDRISQWLIRCRATEEMLSSGLRGSNIAVIQRWLFAELIRSEKRFGGGLESAINIFIQTLADLRALGWTRESLKYYVEKAAWSLTQAIIQKSEASPPESGLIQNFLEGTKYVLAGGSTAMLCVFTLKPPDPRPALTYLKSLTPTSLEIIRADRRPWVVYLGLRAANSFLQDGCQTEALWIMDFLQTNFVQELGLPLPPSRKFSPMDQVEEMLESENESLRLLEELAA